MADNISLYRRKLNELNRTATQKRLKSIPVPASRDDSVPSNRSKSNRREHMRIDNTQYSTPVGLRQDNNQYSATEEAIKLPLVKQLRNNNRGARTQMGHYNNTATLIKRKTNIG